MFYQQRDSGFLMNLSSEQLQHAWSTAIMVQTAITIACVFLAVASGKVSARLPVFINPLQSILCILQYHICLCGKCTCQEKLKILCVISCQIRHSDDVHFVQPLYYDAILHLLSYVLG